ncbi:MAG: hypothetical protein WCG61_00670 [Chlorobium sp.]
MITGIVLAVTFIGISLYIFLMPLPATFAGKNDLQLYALLTGAYGLWRAVRLFFIWKESQAKN